MKFTPKSSEELAMDGLFPAGKYAFQVMKAEEVQSKRTGAEMLKLTLRVFGEGTRETVVFDYLMESVADRLHKFCKHIGMEEAYHAGELEPADVEEKMGWLQLKIQPAKDGWDPKNVVSYYCAGPETTTRQAPPKARPLIGADDDEIDF